MDRFLKSGILERILLPGDGGGVYDCEEDDMDDGHEEEAEDMSEICVSGPDCKNSGIVLRFISPKYCSVRRTASRCSTPAKATTIRSDL